MARAEMFYLSCCKATMECDWMDVIEMNGRKIMLITRLMKGWSFVKSHVIPSNSCHLWCIAELCLVAKRTRPAFAGGFLSM